ncbi:alpha/beta hydrolase [uncultured Tateyamaria sp.]|uniref:alpha/beta hydrolase n=1 Tax=uncultured Tateyamaria sp. TaxID=455651 RepID=UPI002605415E|nr:alpha/beta hydrolase [uncultured Tateyamaria sp.]
MENATFYPKVAGGPAVGSAYWIYANDGVRLRVAAWQTDVASKGTVFMFPGRTEYIEKLGPTANELGKRGFVTFAIDWRGQGLADRITDNPITSHVAQFADYQKDVMAMVAAARDLDLPKPWYLLGHSMGACIGLRAAIAGLPMEACAFTGPMWDLHLSQIERAAAWPLTWIANAIGKGHVFAPGNKPQEDCCYVLSVGFEGNRLTSDPEMFGYMVKQAEDLPDLQTGAPSMGWVLEALKECRALSKMHSPSMPCIALCGEGDVVVDIASVVDRMDRWSGGKLELIPNARHDIMFEVPEVREHVIKKICDQFSD